jgi:hypothetical protein
MRLNKDRLSNLCQHGSISLVPLEGLEPPRPYEQQILSLSRLPFRHRGLTGAPCSGQLLRRQLERRLSKNQ